MAFANLMRLSLFEPVFMCCHVNFLCLPQPLSFFQLLQCFFRILDTQSREKRINYTHNGSKRFDKGVQATLTPN